MDIKKTNITFIETELDEVEVQEKFNFARTEARKEKLVFNKFMKKIMIL